MIGDVTRYRDRGRSAGFGMVAFPTYDSHVTALLDEIEKLTDGSEWRQRILTLLYEGATDDRMKPLVEVQVRLRLEELCRTEDAYMHLKEEVEKLRAVADAARALLEEARCSLLECPAAYHGDTVNSVTYERLEATLGRE